MDRTVTPISEIDASHRESKVVLRLKISCYCCIYDLVQNNQGGWLIYCCHVFSRKILLGSKFL